MSRPDLTVGEISDAFPVCPGRWLRLLQYQPRPSELRRPAANSTLRTQNLELYLLECPGLRGLLRFQAHQHAENPGVQRRD